MNKTLMTAAIIFPAVLSFCCAGQESSSKQKTIPAIKAETQSREKEKTAPSQKDIQLDDILNRLHQQITKMKTYQAKIEYLFIQDPEMLDSRIMQKGMIYYAKDKEGSRIRIDFKTRQQDDGDQEKHIEQYIFDGVWLTRIDYQLEKVDYYQQAEEDKPIDVFEFVSHNFPMVGFTKTEHLRKQFKITLLQDTPGKKNDSFHLHLKAKKDSIYVDDYEEINFWVNKKDYLTRKMVAKSKNGDISDIVLLEIILNKNLKKGFFKVETPKHFGKNIKPLEK
jgi:outer membrane lipoprotein-sorting protein